MEGYRREFWKLRKTHIPTGDPRVAVQLHRSKDICREIIEKCDMGEDDSDVTNLNFNYGSGEDETKLRLNTPQTQVSGESSGPPLLILPK